MKTVQGIFAGTDKSARFAAANLGKGTVKLIGNATAFGVHRQGHNKEILFGRKKALCTRW